jgi:hypothetical protein
MASHVLIRAVLSVLVVAAFVGPGMAQQPAAPNILEQVRQRQQMVDACATTFVVASEVPMELMALGSPQAAREFAKTVADAVANDPDISSNCQERLRDRLSRFLKNSRHRANPLIREALP